MISNHAQGASTPYGENYGQWGTQSHRGTPTFRDGDYNAALLQNPMHCQDPSLLGDKPQVQLEVSQKQRRYLSWGTLLPTLAVFTLTSGLGLAVLVWLLAKRRSSPSEMFRDGYLLVDEGTKKSNNTAESATLRALTVTSFISTIVSATSPILMSLVGYHIAHLWVKEQEKTRSRHDGGPTPLQYGLMLHVLSASSIVSLYDAVRYLFKGKLRPSVPSYFRTAVIMGVIVYVVTHLIGLADLWLHVTTTAVLHNVTSNSEPLLASLAFNETNCNESDYLPNTGVCMSHFGGWARNTPWLVDAGESAVSNSSSDRITITLAEADDMAVTVPLSVNKTAKFKATTFGMRAHCNSLNSLCGRDIDIFMRVNCSNLGITAIPTGDEFVLSVALVAPIHPWNDPAISPLPGQSGLPVGFMDRCGTNPVKSVLQLRWFVHNEEDDTSLNDAVNGWPASTLTLLASCSIEIFNVTLQYDGTTGANNWALDTAGSVPSSERFATILISPYSWQMISDRLTINIRARATVARNVQDVMAALNQELARLALGYVSGSFVFVPATDVQILTPTIVGRYLLAPLLTFTGLLALYGLIALLVFAMSSITTTGSIHVPSELRGKPKDKDVPELKLAQLRLLNPLPIVAQQFGEYRSPTPNFASDPDGRSAKTSAMDLFSETELGGMEVKRLRLGLERGSVRPRYGVWKNE
ncbi:hypothetical protein FRC12_023121 [Ceratobasidium sp. 428]|nr:hypothetical protein FRC12_023121 [Ceratobasidium sp. 428]